MKTIQVYAFFYLFYKIYFDEKLHIFIFTYFSLVISLAIGLIMSRSVDFNDADGPTNANQDTSSSIENLIDNSDPVDDSSDADNDASSDPIRQKRCKSFFCSFG